MQIGELGYGESVESFRKTVYFNIDILDFYLIACVTKAPHHSEANIKRERTAPLRPSHLRVCARKAGHA